MLHFVDHPHSVDHVDLNRRVRIAAIARVIVITNLNPRRFGFPSVLVSMF